jgi:hypothetical protein
MAVGAPEHPKAVSAVAGNGLRLELMINLKTAKVLGLRAGRFRRLDSGPANGRNRRIWVIGDGFERATLLHPIETRHWLLNNQEPTFARPIYGANSAVIAGKFWFCAACLVEVEVIFAPAPERGCPQVGTTGAISIAWCRDCLCCRSGAT